MAGLIAVAALALAPAANLWVCNGELQVGEARGFVSQNIAPDGKASTIYLTLRRGVRREEREEADWYTPEGASLGPPQYLSAWIETAPADEMLWVRFWGDGRYVGQQLLVDHWLLRHDRGGTHWEISLHDPLILRALAQTETWEVEAVGRDGRSYGRRALRLPRPSEIRAAYVKQAAWLARVIRTRAEPCTEVDPNDTGSV
jgi:hypothetical protein